MKLTKTENKVLLFILGFCIGVIIKDEISKT